MHSRNGGEGCLPNPGRLLHEIVDAMDETDSGRDACLPSHLSSPSHVLQHRAHQSQGRERPAGRRPPGMSLILLFSAPSAHARLS